MAAGVSRVVLVAGPPCAGKSTYAYQQAGPGDVVLDQDELGPAEMLRQLGQLGRVEGTAWVIRCAPGPTRRRELAELLGAEVVLLMPSLHTLMSRARERTEARRHVRAIQKWLAEEAADAPPGGSSMDPTPRPRTRW